MEPCSGCSMTSMGMNWEQKGITLSWAPTALRHRGNLNTGVPSFSAATAGRGERSDAGQKADGSGSALPSLSGTVNTPTTLWPCFLRLLYTSWPNRLWPMIASFSFFW
ncbi:hypothetical protein EYF80_049364 [Liparis tanakae]|uniref:Uncharacterized protein n=1 Tax=Liparis tanakae TaxID=230148 RepID=A0A4Z2FI72_9TELE|nr:hypothetical protein EYF80_049364 [Liparis tanakae]